MLKKTCSILLTGLMLVQGYGLPVLAQEEEMIDENIQLEDAMGVYDPATGKSEVIKVKDEIYSIRYIDKNDSWFSENSWGGYKEFDINSWMDTNFDKGYGVITNHSYISKQTLMWDLPDGYNLVNDLQDLKKSDFEKIKTVSSLFDSYEEYLPCRGIDYFEAKKDIEITPATRKISYTDENGNSQLPVKVSIANNKKILENSDIEVSWINSVNELTSEKINQLISENKYLKLEDEIKKSVENLTTNQLKEKLEAVTANGKPIFYRLKLGNQNIQTNAVKQDLINVTFENGNDVFKLPESKLLCWGDPNVDEQEIPLFNVLSFMWFKHGSIKPEEGIPEWLQKTPYNFDIVDEQAQELAFESPVYTRGNKKLSVKDTVIALVLSEESPIQLNLKNNGVVKETKEVKLKDISIVDPDPQAIMQHIGQYYYLYGKNTFINKDSISNYVNKQLDKNFKVSSSFNIKPQNLTRLSSWNGKISSEMLNPKTHLIEIDVEIEEINSNKPNNDSTSSTSKPNNSGSSSSNKPSNNGGSSSSKPKPSTPIGGSGTSTNKPANPTQSQEPATPMVSKKVTYRLFNTLTGEHFYTTNEAERNQLIQDNRWKDEGQGWIAPESSDFPIYRLCNPNTGEHHYTMDKNEYDTLTTYGWQQEGIGLYSADSKDTDVVQLHRLYNPNAKDAGSHHYTVDENEKNTLVAQGWKYEGIAWHGLKSE